MQLEWVHLQAVGPHADFYTKFSPGLVGIVGPNGSGKSTLLEMLFAAFTNEWRLYGVKLDNVRDTVDDKAVSCVEVGARHNGTPFVLTRQLQPDNRSSLVIDQGKPIRRDAEIHRALTDLLEVEIDLLGECGFVPQGRMLQFLERTPVKRAEVFQKICRTTEAAELYDAAGLLLNRDPELQPDAFVDASLDELNERQAQLAREIAELESEKAELKRGALRKDEEEALKELVLEYEQDTVAARRLPELEQHHRRLAGELDDLAVKQAKRHEELRHLRLLLETLEPEEQQLRQAAADHERAEQDRARRQDLEREIKKLKDLEDQDPEPLPPDRPDHLLQDDLPRLRLKLVTVNDQLATAKARLQSFRSGPGKCPTCTTRVSAEKVHGLLSDAAREVKELPDQIRELGDTIRALETYEKERSEQQGRRERRDLKLQAAQRELRGLTSTLPEGSAKACRQKLKQLDTLRQEVAGLDRTIGENEARGRVWRERLAELEQEVDKLGKLVSKWDGREPEVEAARVRLQSYQKAQARFRVVNGILADRTQMLASTQASVAQAGNKRATQDRVRRFRADLEEYRAVFHPTGLPQTVHQSELEGLEDKINASLALFGSPFTVTTTPDLNLLCQFPSGKPRPAQRLSGGQQIVLAFALRQALVPPGLNFLALDEPTVYLDQENLRYLTESFRQLAGRLQEQQVLVITHHRELARVFHQTITLEAP